MRHNNVVSSMCQTSFLPYTQSYLGTGINFQPAPIFRTGVIHFCHPGQFWNCILPFSYTSKFLLTELLHLSFYSLISQFSHQYFQECTLTLFIPNLFWVSFIELYCYTFLMLPIFRTGLIHFCHPSPFWNCILPFYYTSPFLELYYYTYHSIFLFHCFPANTFRNVLLHFLFPTFFWPVPQKCTVTLFDCCPFLELN